MTNPKSENAKMKDSYRESILVNNTKHYPVTFPSIIHLLDFAEVDNSIHHPLGTVYRTKIASHDNKVRIVVLNNNKGGCGGLEAFMFDKVHWGSVKNPFTPEYHEAERVAIRKMIHAGRRVRTVIINMLG